MLHSSGSKPFLSAMTSSTPSPTSPVMFQMCSFFLTGCYLTLLMIQKLIFLKYFFIQVTVILELWMVRTSFFLFLVGLAKFAFIQTPHGGTEVAHFQHFSYHFSQLPACLLNSFHIFSSAASVVQVLQLTQVAGYPVQSACGRW